MLLATFTHMLPLVNIRRTRRLPVNGKVLVRAGQTLGAGDVIAEAAGPGKFTLIDVRRGLGVSPTEKDSSFLQRRVGEKLQAGDVIAQTGGILRRVVRAPAAGVIVNITTGKVLLEMSGTPLQLQAGLNGSVLEIIPERGAMIETNGVLVQGVWGNGKIHSGVLLVCGKNAGSELSAASMDVNMRGAVLLAGFCGQAAALRAAVELQLRGLILGSLEPGLVEMAGRLPFALMLVDGFGREAMNTAAYKVLSTNEKREIAVNASAWNPVTGERPEVVISLPVKGEETAEKGVYRAGQLVRVRSHPGLGKTGRLVALRPGLTSLANGLKVPAATVQFENGQAVVPLANIDVVG
jgi:hypothetical protein